MTEKKSKKQTFSQAYGELNDILTKLEDSDLELEDTAKLYERAMVLRNHCFELLEKEKLKIHNITENNKIPMENSTIED